MSDSPRRIFYELSASASGKVRDGLSSALRDVGVTCHANFQPNPQASKPTNSYFSYAADIPFGEPVMPALYELARAVNSGDVVWFIDPVRRMQVSLRNLKAAGFSHVL